jgi:hypothetical protein
MMVSVIVQLGATEPTPTTGIVDYGWERREATRG